MRAAPPLEFTVRRHGAWRAALLALGITAAAVTALWWHAAGPQAGRREDLLAAAGACCALWPCVEAWRLRALRLRWDGARWHVGYLQAASSTEPLVGRLAVAVDLGGWMLLRCTADAPAGGSAWTRWRGGRPLWIALQRGGLEADWHAIRCTVYSPPPAGPPVGDPAQLSE